MGITFHPSATVLDFFEGIETVLFLCLVLVQTPVILVLLYCCVCQLRLFKSTNDDDLSYISKTINNMVFNITHSMYQFIKYDDSFEVPRFVMFGFIAPIYYSYHLLVFGIVFMVSFVYQFWESLFISSQTMVPCDGNSTSIIDDNMAPLCVSIDIKVRATFNIVLTTSASIVIVYTAALKFLLRFTGGKKTFDRMVNRIKVKPFTRLKFYFAVSVQLFVVFIVKPSFTVYFIVAYFQLLPIDSVFDHEGWFTTGLFVDVIFFVMLTPWFLFEKIDHKEQGFKPVKTDEEETH